MKIWGNFRLALLSVLVTAVVLVSGVAAYAKPMVSLVLSGVVVTKDAKGEEQTTPLANAAVAPGQVIRYSILVSNKGDQDARNVIPVGKIPVGTMYESGSASSKNALRVEFSLDGGKAWSAHPMVMVHTPTGEVMKPADPAKYTSVRWIAERALAPKAAVTYTYAVKVK